ncbi:hypothetical protein E1287_00580 [Actinomadura sp. KC06]|uniref:hypothetical protein n=1 Tax=Actinomadura sp. KC06 TaxID=2530369 RepID=UPI00104CFA06|nr:hypothetical protein [Actinomadura sp. KC06]TDD40502.1 hypothetical protein E1287_00580 [Actinomadura sp. KC06]
MDDPTRAGAPAGRPGGIVAVLAVAGVIAALMQTLVVRLIGEPKNALCIAFQRNSSFERLGVKAGRADVGRSRGMMCRAFPVPPSGRGR